MFDGEYAQLGLDVTVELGPDAATALQVELRQVLGDLNLTQHVRIEIKEKE